MRRQRNMIQTKEYDKISGKKELKKLEISNLPNKVFKVMFIKVLTKLERKMNEHSENLNKDIENI